MRIWRPTYPGALGNHLGVPSGQASLSGGLRFDHKHIAQKQGKVYFIHPTVPFP